MEKDKRVQGESWKVFASTLTEEMQYYMSKEDVVGSYPCEICQKAFTFEDWDSDNIVPLYKMEAFGHVSCCSHKDFEGTWDDPID